MELDIVSFGAAAAGGGGGGGGGGRFDVAYCILEIRERFLCLCCLIALVNNMFDMAMEGGGGRRNEGGGREDGRRGEEGGREYPALMTSLLYAPQIAVP